MCVHGFDLARNAAVEELQVLVCECTHCEIAHALGSLKCASEGAKHGGVNFSGVAVAVLWLAFACIFMTRHSSNIS